jgi:hypothetical protein
MIYYGLTDAEKRLKKVVYKKNSKFSGKGLNTSLLTLLQEIKGVPEIEWYVILPENKFKILDEFKSYNGEPVAKTPFVLNLTGHKILPIPKTIPQKLHSWLEN